MTRKITSILLTSLAIMSLQFTNINKIYAKNVKPQVIKSYSDNHWLRYPAISPDGKNIAFTHKGDIFLVSTKGGLARPLTSNPNIDFMPVWSHDGKTLAFASNRHGNFDVFTMPAKGGKAKRLTFHSANDYPSDFSIDNNRIIFSATRLDDVKNSQFPYGLLEELYSVSIKGGTPKQILTTPALMAKYSNQGRYLLYTDHKGYENEWRKHEVSSRSRDVWRFDTKTRQHKKLTQHLQDDRNAVWDNNGKGFYYLSEKSGSFNIWHQMLSSNKAQQITHFKHHPVRFLSISQNKKLAFSFDGNLYTQSGKGKPSLIPVSFAMDENSNPVKKMRVSNQATEISVSPTGKEIAFVVRGDIFVTSSDFATTKRITDTPTQERSISFSPDGRKILYAAERGNSWKVMQTSIKRKQEKQFSLATVLEEDTLVNTDKESFQPSWSPDGKKIAFLEERTTLKVMDLKSKKVTTILKGRNYSYSDGDQHYAWSPDSKWFEVDFLEPNSWIAEVGVISADGKGKVHNISESGYQDGGGTWSSDGNVLIWQTDRQGMRSHGGWGSQFDIYAAFLNQKSLDKFNLNKEEFALYQEQQKADKKAKQKAAKKDEKKKNKDKSKKEDIAKINIDFKNIDDRLKRLTINSSNISDAKLSKEGDKLFYLSEFEKGYDLWMHDFREDTTKIVDKLGAKQASFEIDKEGKNAFILADGTIKKLDLKTFKAKPVAFAANVEVDANGERHYLLRHIWRQVKKKFYDPKLHGVNWASYWHSYSDKLDDINNNFDFAELASEMLGELNASHTGARFRSKNPQADHTPSLGVYFDNHYQGHGLKIAEVIEKSPLIKAKSKIKKGTILEKINGKSITSKINVYQLLNNQTGKPLLLSLYYPNTGKRWEEVTKPISRGELNQLLYQRWVKSRQVQTEKLSNGKIGYVHVKAMNDASFRKVFSELMGPLHNKQAVVVDTRFNGGGWLHDDLVTFLSGKHYMDYLPRKKYLTSEPQFKWYKPSIVLMGEGNYSDAHMFPYAYKELKIGKLVGMPVPGTGTAVWWERLQTGDLVFGIPEVGSRGLDGKYLENQQLDPDIQVENDPSSVAKGRDKQLEAAVKALLK